MDECLIPQSVLRDIYKTREMMREMAEQTRPYFEQMEKVRRDAERIFAPIAETIRPIQLLGEQVAAEQKKMREIADVMVSPFISLFKSNMDIGEIFTPRIPVILNNFGGHTINEKISAPIVNLHVAKISTQKELQTKAVQKIQLPVKTWEEVEFRFKDKHTLSVFCKDKKIGTYDYADLGFVRKNTTDKKFDKQWDFLYILSVVQISDQFKPTTQNLACHMKIKPAALQKIKESLCKKIQSAFSIESDPFCSYRSRDGYYPRFTLKPEPILQGDGELHRSGTSYIDSITGEDDPIFNDFE